MGRRKGEDDLDSYVVETKRRGGNEPRIFTPDETNTTRTMDRRQREITETKT
jgi:hypothetical protein